MSKLSLNAAILVVFAALVTDIVLAAPRPALLAKGAAGLEQSQFHRCCSPTRHAVRS